MTFEIAWQENWPSWMVQDESHGEAKHKAYLIWQAAQKEAARRCAEIARTWDHGQYAATNIEREFGLDRMSDDAIIPKSQYDVLRVQGVNAEPIVVIKPDGRIFWRGREVETDENFRAAMLELVACMVKHE